MKYNDSAVPLTVTQQEKIKRYGDVKQYAMMYRYIADEIKAGHINIIGGTSSSQYYWFDQAARINAADTQSPASFFIRAATRYGLAIDGKPTTAAYIQGISDSIGKKVYQDLKDKRAIPPFSQQFNRDISSSTNEGGMTLGGWGGAFYFWHETYIDPKTRQQTTVGEYIRSNPVELKKFISVNSRAIADTVSQFSTNLMTDPAFSDALFAGIKNFNHSPESRAVGTHLLAATTLELKRRGFENLAQAFNEAVANLRLSVSSVINLSDTTYNNLITDLQTRFAQAEITTSPLIIDLDGGGIQTLGLNAGIHFDHDHNGFAQLSGWAGKGEALVVRDLNSDGKIDSGLELFGNHTTLKNGTKAANGFIALAEFDANNDGQIDTNEANSAKIQLWRDANTNGIVDAGELLNFVQGGIKSLGTRYAEQNTSDAQGNQHRQIGSVIKTDGSRSAMHDVWFKQDTARTVDKEMTIVNSAIATLPNIEGFGNVHSLHQAMAREKTGTLQTLVKKLVTSTPYHERQSLYEKILFHWTGADQYSQQSRGRYISDGRKLYVLEAFLGKAFIQSSGTNEGLSDPGPEAAKVIERAYAQLSQTINQQLTAQIFYKPLYDGLTLRWNKQTQSLEINADGLIQYLQKQYAIAPVSTQILLYEFAATLNTQGEFGKNILDVIKLKGDPDGQGLQRDLAFISHHVTYGTQKNDTLAGIRDHNNLISGDSGDDTLTAGNKNDILIGGQGNDTLYLGTGQNTVIYNLGDGKDTIHTKESDYKPNRTNNDILKLGTGITAAATQLVRGLGYNSNDLTLVFQDGGEVKLKDYFSHYHNLGTIQFADGTQWHTETVTNRLNTQNPARHARMASQAGQVDQLIHAMAAFAPPAAGETSVLPDHRVMTTSVLVAG